MTPEEIENDKNLVKKHVESFFEGVTNTLLCPHTDDIVKLFLLQYIEVNLDMIKDTGDSGSEKDDMEDLNSDGEEN